MAIWGHKTWPSVCSVRPWSQSLLASCAIKRHCWKRPTMVPDKDKRGKQCKYIAFHQTYRCVVFMALYSWVYSNILESTPTALLLQSRSPLICLLHGKADLAPYSEHFLPDTMAANRMISGISIPVFSPYKRVPTVASPAPVVSLIASWTYHMSVYILTWDVHIPEAHTPTTCGILYRETNDWNSLLVQRHCQVRWALCCQARWYDPW